MSQPVNTLEPHWLKEARRRAKGTPHTLPSQGASHDRRLLLAAYDEVAAALATTTEQLAAARQEGEKAQRLAKILGDAHAKALQELGEQEVEKMQLENEIEAYKLVHQGMQTKWHAILRQVMAPLPDFDEAVRSGKAMQRAGYTSATSIINCQKDCEACAAAPAQVAVAPPAESEYCQCPFPLKVHFPCSPPYCASCRGRIEWKDPKNSGGGLPLERGADAPEAGEEQANG